MTVLVCPGCNEPLDAGANSAACPRCGHALAPSAEPASEYFEANPAAATKQVVTHVARAGQTALGGSQPANPTDAPPANGASGNNERTMSWAGDGPAPPNSAPPEKAELTSFLAPPQADDELGRLGNYRMLKILGAGGMGVVFHAEDIVLKRPVAIKAMLPSVAGKLINRQRFLREAQAMAAVKNEHVITIYQVNVDRGVPYLAMEFLEGEPLDIRLGREQRLTPLQVARIGRQTAEGLASAHERGLIHRDIKPGNLWLVNPRDRVVILDFGLARVVEEDTSLTRPGVILGTPSYMSPEQARSQPLDGRSDLFSLGIVLYHSVTGTLPFRGSDAFAVITALALETPKPVWNENPDVPWPLGKLIMQLLEKDPDERPTSAAEVAQTLVAVEKELRNPPIEVFAPVSPPSRPRPVAPVYDDAIAVDTADEDAVEVTELEILPDDTELPVISAKHLHELTGRTLGAYEIGPVLGQGHHGVVFRAREQRTGQAVALKVLAPEFPHSEGEAQQFNHAMGTALTLSHPNLVRLHAAGKTGPYCWMAEQYVEGKSLAQILHELDENPRASWQLGLRVAVHIARALDFTGQHRLVHGNVTPKNILVRGKDQVILLNDLRLLSALKGSQLQKAVVEQKRTAERTYLAPEQVEGDDSYIDFVCDIYSLGASVYHVITGQPIFRSETLKEAIAAIRGGMPTRPRKHLKSIPRAFEVVVMRMLAKHQEDRYQSAGELLADLAPIADQYDIA